MVVAQANCPACPAFAVKPRDKDADFSENLKLKDCRCLATEYQPGGADPISPSAVAIANGEVFTPSGKALPYPVPRALDASEIPGVVKQYADGARNSLAAGALPLLMASLHLCWTWASQVMPGVAQESGTYLWSNALYGVHEVLLKGLGTSCDAICRDPQLLTGGLMWQQQDFTAWRSTAPTDTSSTSS